MTTASFSEKSVDFTITLRYPKDKNENILSPRNESNDSFSCRDVSSQMESYDLPHYLWFSQQLFMGHVHTMELVFHSDVCVQYVTLHRTKVQSDSEQSLNIPDQI